MHLVILKDGERLPSSQLDSDIKLWTSAMQVQESELTRSILATVLFVGKKLQQD